MRFRRFWAITRKEFLHIIRDPRSLLMAMGIPMLQLILFGYALTLDVDNVPLLVWDRDNSPLSRDFLSYFQGSRYFSITNQARNYLDIESAIDTGQVLAALVIPEDFAKKINSGRGVAVQLILDGSDANTATLSMGYAEMVTKNFSQKIIKEHLEKQGILLPSPLLELRPRVWFNPDLESKNFIIPGLIAIIMNVIAALLTSLTVAREWEMGTMEQLISTPIKGPELVLGKLFPYFTIGLVDVLIAVLMGKFLFKVPLRGSIFLLFSISAVFLIGILSIGLLLSIITRHQLLASQGAMIVTYLPALILSGYMFAIHNMPKALQVITYFVPARYFVKILRSIFLKGLGGEFLALEIGFLIIFSAVILILAHWKFRKKLA